MTQENFFPLIPPQLLSAHTVGNVSNYSKTIKKKKDNLHWLSCQKLEMSVFDTLSYMNSFLGDSRMSGGQEILGLGNWILAV